MGMDWMKEAASLWMMVSVTFVLSLQNFKRTTKHSLDESGREKPQRDQSSRLELSRTDSKDLEIGVPRVHKQTSQSLEQNKE